MNLWWVWHKIQITNDATPKECARERPSANSNGDSKFSSPSNASKHSVNFKFQGPLFRANVDIQECNMFNNSLKRLIIETLLYKWVRKSQSGKLSQQLRAVAEASWRQRAGPDKLYTMGRTWVISQEIFYCTVNGWYIVVIGCALNCVTWITFGIRKLHTNLSVVQKKDYKIMRK